MPTERLKQLSQDPEFQKLSYDEQRYVRSQLAQQELQANPQFHVMTPQEQSYILEQISNQPPVWGPDDQPSEKAQQWIELAKQVEQGNPQAEEQALALVRQGEWASSTGVAGQVIQWLGNTGLKVADTLGIELDDEFRGQVKDWEDSVERTSPAEREAWQYFQYALSQNERTAKPAGRVVKWAPLVGAGLDIGLGAAVGAPVRGGVPNLVRAAGGKLGQTGQKLVGSWLPNMIESGYDAGILSLSSYLQDRTEGRDWADAGMGEAAIKAAQTFGAEFLTDFGFFMTLRLLGKTAKGMTNVFRFGPFGGQKTARAVPGPEASVEDIEKVVFGGQDELLTRISSMPKGPGKEAVQRAHLDLRLARQFGKLEPGTDEFNRVVARAKGAELYPNADGTWTARQVKSGEAPIIGRKFASSENALTASLRKIRDDINTAARQGAQEASNVAPAPRIRVRQVVEGSMKQTDLDTETKDSVIRLLSPDEAGKLSEGNVKQAMRNLYKASGAPLKEANKIEVVKTADKKLLRKGMVTQDNKKILFAPKKLTTPGQHEDFLKRTLKLADEDIQKLKPRKRVSEPRRIIDDFDTEVEKAGVSPAWTKAQVKKLDPQAAITREGTNVALKSGGRTIRQFGNMKQLNEWLGANARRDISDAEFQKHLTKEHGLFMKYESEGGITIRRPRRKGQSEIVYGKEDGYSSVQEVLEQHPELAPKLPVSSMPDLVVKGSGQVEVTGNTVAAKPKEILEILERYKDYSRTTQRHVVKRWDTGEAITVNDAQTLWRIEAPEMGFSRDFKKLSEAKQFLQQNVDEFDYVEAVGFAKGIRVFPEGDHFVAQHSLTGETKFLNSYGDLKDFVANAKQDPAIGKELTGLPEHVLARIESDIKAEGFKLPEAGEPPMFTDMDFIKHVRHTKRFGKGLKSGRSAGWFFRQVDPWVRDVAEDVGDPKLYEKFHTVFEAQNAVRADLGRVEQFMEKLLRGSNATDRKMYLGMLGADQAKWPQVAQNFGRELKPLDLERVQRMRELLNQGAKQFGIDGEKFVKNYLPRLRNMVREGQLEGYRDAAHALRHQFGSNKEMDFFAQHLRTRDVANFVEETDVQDLIEGYFRIGYKNLHLGPAYEDAVKYVNAHEGLAQQSGTIQQRMIAILDRTRGYQGDDLQEAINEGVETASRKFFQWMEKKNMLPKGKTADDLVVKDFIGTLQGGSIMGLMAGRPWLPIRNMQQVWSTLAPRVGNDTVWRAIDKVNADPGKYVRELRSTGRVRDRLPIFGAKKLGRSSKLTQVMMTPYMNSDHYTRAVVAASVEDLFEKAQKSYNPADVERFIRAAGIDNMHPQSQELILKRLQEEGTEAAQMEMAGQLTNETMFSYRASDNPGAFQGAVGRVFGQFGHYPTGYIENVRTGLFGKPLNKKIAMASRMAMNFAALTFFFREVFGISNSAFNPMGQMVFSGGPYYDWANQVLQTMSPYHIRQYGVEGTVGGLLEELGRLVPGFAQYSRVRTHLNEIAEGKRYEGFLGLLSFPTSGETRWFPDPIVLDLL